MARISSLLALSLAAASFAVGCGNVDRMEVELSFSDPDIGASTRQLLVVVREPAPAGDSCDALWGPIQPGLGETARLVDYPNREDILVVPLEARAYSVFAYAYPVRLTQVACSDNAVCPADWSCADLDGGQRACVPPDASARSLGGGCDGGVVGQETELVQLEVWPRPQS